MYIKFSDIQQQNKKLLPEIEPLIKEIITKSSFISGKFVHQFELAFAKDHQAKYCVAVNSGTAALHLALWANDIGLVDEVIVPTNTFFSTPESISLTGAKPVFVDCNEFYHLDFNKLQQVVTAKTKAIIPVHLYGLAMPMDSIINFAQKNKLLVIEDCAQAHLATYNKQYVGTFGKAGCFSFYPGKNLGTFGEGGAVITNDENIYNKMLALRGHGSQRKYHHHMVGHNYRMNEIQGAVLDTKLKYLNNWTSLRQKNAALYKQQLAELQDDIILPLISKNSEHVYHLFVIQVKHRDKLQQFLEKNGIGTSIHYPIPCHLQPAYTHLNNKNLNNFNRAEENAKTMLSLPMYPELTEQQINFVFKKIKEFCYIKESNYV